MTAPQHPCTPAPLHLSTPAPQHVLITGGCGFIGVNLVETLIRNRLVKTIRIMDDLSVGTKEELELVLSEFGDFRKRCCDKRINYIFKSNSHPSVELLIEDIRNAGFAEKATRGVKVVVHLAANTGVAPSVETPRLDMEVNVIGTFNMLEASRQNNVQKFIFASSGAPLGEVEPPIHEGKVPRPVSPYGASKLAGEAYCSAYYRTFGLKTVSLRFGNVYGLRSKHKNSVVAKFLKQALAEETLQIYGDGRQTRDFLYISDLINAIVLAIKVDTGGEVFQIATHRETSINEIAEVVKELVERETGKRVNIVYESPRPGDVKRNFSDISKARKILGFEPRYNLLAGLRETFEYFELS